MRKKNIMPFEKTWMRLDIMLSEVSQTKKGKCCMMSLAHEI